MKKKWNESIKKIKEWKEVKYNKESWKVRVFGWSEIEWKNI